MLGFEALTRTQISICCRSAYGVLEGACSAQLGAFFASYCATEILLSNLGRERRLVSE